MRRKSIVVGISVLIIGMIAFIGIYWITISNTLGNINYNCSKPTSSISDFTFEGESGDKLNFALSSNVENGSLDILLYDSKGNVVYELDRAKALATHFVLEKTDTYTLSVEYSDFIGKFKINVTK